MLFCVSWEPSFCNLFTRVLVDAKEIDIFLGSSRVHFFFRSNQWNLGSRWYRFPISCGMLYCTTTNNSQEFLRHYFSLRNHSFARVNQIDSCFMFSYKSAFIWLGRGIRTGTVLYRNQQSTTVLGQHSLFHSHFWLVSVYSLFLSVSHVRTYNLQTNQHDEKFKIHLTRRRT